MKKTTNCVRVVSGSASDRAKDVFYLLLDPGVATTVHTMVRKFAYPPQVEAPEGSASRYVITGPSLWNFAAAGGTARAVLKTIRRVSKLRLAPAFEETIQLLMARYGRIVFIATPRKTKNGDQLVLMKADPVVLRGAVHDDYRVEAFCYEEGAKAGEWYIPFFLLNRFKRFLGWLGYPTVDRIKRAKGRRLSIELRRRTRIGAPFSLRPYQRAARDAFMGTGRRSGYDRGVCLAPPGTGKTIEGIALMATLQRHTLIITVTQEAVSQWIRELLDKTTLRPEDVGEYTSRCREIRPVTVTTYMTLANQMGVDPKEIARFEASLRKGRAGRKEVLRLGLLMNQKLSHFDLFQVDESGASPWGFIIFDEVDRLPADHWRVAAQIEAAYALGLTATAVREDGRVTEESGRMLGELFNLVGPMVHELTYPEARTGKWIAPVKCFRVQVPLKGKERSRYTGAEKQEQRQIAWHNSQKIAAVQEILRRHQGRSILVIGHFLEALQRISAKLGSRVPYLNGSTSLDEREHVFRAFRDARTPAIIVSSIGDRAIDFPDAEVLVQVNGLYGSRAQEGQRLGRILRPKKGGRSAYYYNLVTPETPEEEDADKRQAYVAAKGFSFRTIPFAAI